MKKICINDNWIVTETGLSDDPFAGAGEGKRVTLPHDAMIAKERIPELAGGAAQGYYPDGDYCYEKTIEYNNADGRCYVEFEGAYNNAMVYVNGNAAGGCRYGYSDFILDITDYLQQGVNSIRVETRAGIGRNTRWYSGNGLYRNVYLYEGGSAGFVPGALRVTTESISASDTAAADGKTDAVIRACGSIYGIECQDEYEVKVRVRGFDGQDACSVGSCLADENGCYDIVLTVENAALWSAEKPCMYRIETELSNGSEVIDTECVSFGIRTIGVKAGEGLLINGATVKLRGGCIHSENGIVGAAEYEALAERRIRILKEAGFNSVRISHHPASPAILDACDKIGMYVMDESFDTWNVSKTQYDYTMWFEENWRKDLDSLVRKDHNHPSVIMYTIGNEIKELDTVQGIEQNRIMYEYMKKLDPTRPVSNAVNGMFTAMAHMPEIMTDVLGDAGKSGEAAEGVSSDINQVMSFLDNNMDDIMRHKYVSKMLDPICENLDIAGYNYMGGRYDTDAADHPERIIVGSETRPDTIAPNWERVKKLPNVIGDFVWTAWDYIGEAGIGRIDHEDLNGPMYGSYPWMLSCTGDIDILGFRRPQSYYREIVWGLRKKPYIAVGRFPDYGKPARTSNWSWTEVVRSWTWNGYEGKTAHIEVYSDADEIELLLNGKPLGRSKVGANRKYTAEFEIPYEAGTLTAIAYTGGDVSGEDSIVTAGDDKQIHVDVTKGDLADGINELIVLDITIGDKNRVVDYMAAPEISISLEGDIELLGFGSADPKTTVSYSSTKNAAFDGRLQAVLRAPKYSDCDWSAVISCSGIKDAVVKSIKNAG